MAKKKKASMDAGATRYRRIIELEVGPPESLKDWKADIESAYMQGWMDALKHLQRLTQRRAKRRH